MFEVRGGLEKPMIYDFGELLKNTEKAFSKGISLQIDVFGEGNQTLGSVSFDRPQITIRPTLSFNVKSLSDRYFSKKKVLDETRQIEIFKPYQFSSCSGNDPGLKKIKPEFFKEIIEVAKSGYNQNLENCFNFQRKIVAGVFAISGPLLYFIKRNTFNFLPKFMRHNNTALNIVIFSVPAFLAIACVTSDSFCDKFIWSKKKV